MTRGTIIRFGLTLGLIALLASALMGCAQLQTAGLVLSGAQNGNGNIARGKRCERDCGQITTWKNGKKVVINE